MTSQSPPLARSSSKVLPDTTHSESESQLPPLCMAQNRLKEGPRIHEHDSRDIRGRQSPLHSLLNTVPRMPSVKKTWIRPPFPSGPPRTIQSHPEELDGGGTFSLLSMTCTPSRLMATVTALRPPRCKKPWAGLSISPWKKAHLERAPESAAPPAPSTPGRTTLGPRRLSCVGDRRVNRSLSWWWGTDTGRNREVSEVLTPDWLCRTGLSRQEDLGNMALGGRCGRKEAHTQESVQPAASGTPRSLGASGGVRLSLLH